MLDEFWILDKVSIITILIITIFPSHVLFLHYQVKEALCYVSLDFKNDLTNCSQRREPSVDFNGNCLLQHYVLPDYHRIMKGFIREFPDCEDVPPPGEHDQVRLLA
jgi:hypothetical protein